MSDAIGAGGERGLSPGDCYRAEEQRTRGADSTSTATRPGEALPDQQYYGCDSAPPDQAPAASITQRTTRQLFAAP